MSSNIPRAIREVTFDEAAGDYLRRLPLEHFMEAIPQSTQREITLESLALVRARRSDFHVFNELLIQYDRPRRRKPGQIVPSNMAVIADKPIQATNSYNVPLEPEPPFWVMEYVSKNSKRKDYQESFQKYEQELKVPYYLVFCPDNQELTLSHLENERYVSIKPNEAGRYRIEELDIELALMDGWIRFWWQGVLLPLPAEMQEELRAAVQKAHEEKQRADAMQLRLDIDEQTIRELREKIARLEARKNGPSSVE